MPYPFVSNWCREGEQYLRYSDILSVCVTVSPIAPFSAKWVVHWGGEIGWLSEDGKNLKTFSSASKAKEAADERLRQKEEAWRKARNPKTFRVALEKIRPELYEKEMLEYESISMTWENWAASLFYIVLSIGPPQPLLTPMPKQEALEHALNLLTWYSDIEKNVKWITSRERYFHPDNTDDFEEAD